MNLSRSMYLSNMPSLLNLFYLATVPKYFLLVFMVVKFQAAPFDICIYSINCIVLFLPSPSPPHSPPPGLIYLFYAFCSL